MLIPLGILAGKNPIKATGGDIVISGGYVYHTFKTSGTFAPTTTISNAEYLAIGGGGGSSGTGGGGGAGGYRLVTNQTYSSSFSIVIGAGGFNDANGSNTTNGSGTIFAYGGGYGLPPGGTSSTARFEASGGGGTSVGSFGYNNGQSNTGGFGNSGGQGYTGNYAGGLNGGGGGGGGAGGAGGDANPSTLVAGAGGAGIQNTTWANATNTGVSGFYAGGGNGGFSAAGSGWIVGSASSGGGGGSSTPNGVANTGGGAGNTSGGGIGTGGSGLMIVRYPV